MGVVGRHCGPVGVDGAQHGQQCTQERNLRVKKLASLWRIQPADARERRGRQDAVGLPADADRRNGAAAADVLCEIGAGAGDDLVAEHRRHQLVHPVADGRRPQRPLHRPRAHLVLAIGGMHGGEQRGIDAKRLGEPLPVALEHGVAGRGEQRRIVAVVEALVGIVAPGEAGAGVAAVVGRRALRNESEPAAPGGVMAQQLLQRRLAIALPAAELQPEDEQPVEPGSRLLRREIDSQRHAGSEGAFEVDHPFQLVGHEQVAAVGVDRRGRIGLGIGRRIRTDIERQRDHVADRLQRLVPPLKPITTNRSGNCRTCGACDHALCRTTGSGGKMTKAVDSVTPFLSSGGVGRSVRLNGT